ncbi:MAG: carboxypeptidase-like regulatory domain-containing protein [Putridiphycobacter sp.]|nr:carboxypeptidase-like regulatory domain-containing protein [Putridiphycobacter sp.]
MNFIKSDYKRLTLINVKKQFEQVFFFDICSMNARMLLKALFVCLFLYGSNVVIAQESQTTDSLRFVQLTGIVVNDSMERLPFTAVYDKTTRRGVIADYYGYFALVVHPGDTLQFSYIGYKKKTFVIPMPDSTNELSIVSLLESDTIYTQAVTVYPWPSKEDFAEAFISLKIDNDAINRAKERLSPQEMAFVYGDLSSDPSLSYGTQSQQYLNQIYYRGQQAPTNLLNPLAWSNFLKSLNNGDLKIMR